MTETVKIEIRPADILAYFVGKDTLVYFVIGTDMAAQEHILGEYGSSNVAEEQRMAIEESLQKGETIGEWAIAYRKLLENLSKINHYGRTYRTGKI